MSIPRAITCSARWPWLVVFSLAVCVLALGGCGDPGAPRSYLKSPEELFWSLELNYRAVNLSTASPYDTLTLIATPRDVYGNAIPGTHDVTFVSTTNLIAVTPNGTLHALGQTSSTGNLIMATAMVNGVTRSDTARVVVTNVTDPARMKTFSIQPLPGDSALIPAVHLVDQQPKNIQFQALDSTQKQIPRVVVHFRSSNIAIGRFLNSWQMTFMGWNPGEVMIHASAMVYGVAKRDSLRMQVTERNVAVLTVKPGVGVKREVIIRPGGGAYWVNQRDDSLDIVFDEPEQAAKLCCLPLGLSLADTSGNIRAFMRDMTKPVGIADGSFLLPRLEPDIAKGRSFLRRGEYKYHSTRHPDIFGTIIVR